MYVTSFPQTYFGTHSSSATPSEPSSEAKAISTVTISPELANKVRSSNNLKHIMQIVYGEQVLGTARYDADSDTLQIVHYIVTDYHGQRDLMNHAGIHIKLPENESNIATITYEHPPAETRQYEALGGAPFLAQHMIQGIDDMLNRNFL